MDDRQLMHNARTTSKADHRFTFRCEPRLVEEFRRVALSEDRSASAEIRRLMRQRVAAKTEEDR